MIATWMVQCVVVSALLALTAAAVERASRLWRREARLAWALAILLSLVLPILSIAQATGWLPSFTSAPSIAGLTPAPFAVLLAPIRVEAGVTRVDIGIAIAWALVSLGLTTRFAFAARRVARRRAAWRVADVDGQMVFVSPDAGPAVVGFRTPAVVVPEWVLGMDRPLRTLVLRHEREHVDRRDPRLLLSAVAVATITPWNPAVWFQLYRLRAAMELDCDLRVLRAHPDTRRYGSLLIAVAQRADRVALLEPALTEATSLLTRRIRAMREQLKPFRIARTVIFTGAALLAGFVACDVQGPAQPRGAAVEAASMQVAPIVVKEPFFEFQVEVPVRPAPGTAAPRYPDALRRAKVEGEVLAQFVVGANGRADVESFKVLESTHPLFVDAVRSALPQMRFTPAMVGDRAVRQLVQLPFTFSLSR